jgi:probable addiction module antidote protein
LDVKVKERKIAMLRLVSGKVPFETWHDKLAMALQRAVDARLTRLAVGNFGDHKALGAGVYELRIMKSSGLRRKETLKKPRSYGGNTMKTKDYKAALLKRLKDPEYAAGYLADVLETESQEAFLIAVRNVLDARKANVSKVSKKSGITRQALYRALSKRGNPRLSTLHGILKAAGLRIVFEPEKKAA